MESKSWPFRKPFGFTKPDTPSSRLCFFVRMSERATRPSSNRHFLKSRKRAGRRCENPLGCSKFYPNFVLCRASRLHVSPPSKIRRRITPQRIGSTAGRGGGGNNAINNNKEFVNDSSSPPPLPWSSLQQHDSTPRTPTSASMSHQPPYFLGCTVLGSRPSCACAWIRLVHSAMSKLLASLRAGPRIPRIDSNRDKDQHTSLCGSTCHRTSCEGWPYARQCGCPGGTAAA
jgi:hypothetical protein